MDIEKLQEVNKTGIILTSSAESSDPCVVQGWAELAINKPVFLAGDGILYTAARYRADFMAAIENNQGFPLIAH